MGSRSFERMARQEQLRRHLLSLTFGVVLPILVLLCAGVGFIATFSGS